jgi:hypothetical protein
MMFVDYPWADLGKATVVDSAVALVSLPTSQHINTSTGQPTNFEFEHLKAVSASS